MDIPPAIIIPANSAAGDVHGPWTGPDGTTVTIVDNGDGTQTVIIRSPDGSVRLIREKKVEREA